MSKNKTNMYTTTEMICGTLYNNYRLTSSDSPKKPVMQQPPSLNTAGQNSSAKASKFWSSMKSASAKSLDKTTTTSPSSSPTGAATSPSMVVKTPSLKRLSSNLPMRWTRV